MLLPSAYNSQPAQQAWRGPLVAPHIHISPPSPVKSRPISILSSIRPAPPPFSNTKEAKTILARFEPGSGSSSTLHPPTDYKGFYVKVTIRHLFIKLTASTGGSFFTTHRKRARLQVSQHSLVSKHDLMEPALYQITNTRPPFIQPAFRKAPQPAPLGHFHRIRPASHFEPVNIDPPPTAQQNSTGLSATKIRAFRIRSPPPTLNQALCSDPSLMHNSPSTRTALTD
ncbi:unnamed protein product [Linum trigynum]|uniref:Uncharacterized protein n=1 Tax=Linum trigynum TaxID=586398 RepID=A0AAV2FC16_9ROSI